MYTLTGTLKVKQETKQIKDSFRKREFVVTENSSQYPQHVSFQLTQDKCELLDSIEPGDQVTISFFIRGREWVSREGETKYFNSLDAWKIEAANGGSTQDVSDPFPASEGVDAETDDLPF
ncbi:MAG: DUF3127 domain-containing protein [Flavobacteriales bacterium]|nr:DUF3127 domain-containing protein [Flavobacteriales bacterium]MCB9448430.1 DUF3127 domain-containing protein [Flavobacteriales bacterium]